MADETTGPLIKLTCEHCKYVRLMPQQGYNTLKCAHPDAKNVHFGAKFTTSSDMGSKEIFIADTPKWCPVLGFFSDLDLNLKYIYDNYHRFAAGITSISDNSGSKADKISSDDITFVIERKGVVLTDIVGNRWRIKVAINGDLSTEEL